MQRVSPHGMSSEMNYAGPDLINTIAARGASSVLLYGNSDECRNLI